MANPSNTVAGRVERVVQNRYVTSVPSSPDAERRRADQRKRIDELVDTAMPYLSNLLAGIRADLPCSTEEEAQVIAEHLTVLNGLVSQAAIKAVNRVTIRLIQSHNSFVEKK